MISLTYLFFINYFLHLITPLCPWGLLVQRCWAGFPQYQTWHKPCTGHLARSSWGLVSLSYPFWASGNVTWQQPLLSCRPKWVVGLTTAYLYDTAWGCMKQIHNTQNIFKSLSYCLSFFSKTACERKNAEAARLLVQYNADTNHRCNRGWTALHEAVSRNDLEIMDILVKGGAKIESANAYGITSLFVAAESGQLEALRYLARCGEYSLHTSIHLILNNSVFPSNSPWLSFSVSGGRALPAEALRAFCSWWWNWVGSSQSVV